MSQPVFVIAEQIEGVFRKITYEAVSAGRQLADQCGAELTVAVLGAGVADMAAELADFGADRIVVADDAALADYATEAYTTVLAGLIQSASPSAVVLGASSQGKDLAGRLSARLDAALAMDCIAVKIQDGTLIATRPMYGGKVMADVALAGASPMVAVRPKSMAVVKAKGAGQVQAAPVETGTVRTRVVAKQVEAGKVDLTEADVVVSGGRGMGGDDYSVVEALAKTLGGAVGASRSAVDEGWRSASDQVGQTGKVVSPNLYIACGISGAIQHLAGMSSSKVIVAINKDPEAPIFAKADYGLVGDLFEIVPELNAQLQQRKG